MSMKLLNVGTVPPNPGHLPEKMLAWVVRQERHGDPLKAFQLEEIETPKPAPLEVVILVMAAGVNYNGIWASLGTPVPISKLHPDVSHHIGGSDASGIVWTVGSSVKNWKPGDEVIVHPNQSCGECAACNGQDPLACRQQKAWGYETSWGSFAQFAKVQAQQLLTKPRHLSWEESASYGLKFFTAYRMLVDRAKVTAGDNVLIWGGAGGLGSFAIQLCRLLGANPIAVVSSEERAEFCRRLGADWTINRMDFQFARKENETPEERQMREKEMRRFGQEIRRLTGGEDPDIVFEHVGRETFPTSVFVCKRFGTIVTCGATSGYHLDFDARYLWMHQKSILGSHGCNAYQAYRANRLVMEKKIRPILGSVFSFDEVPQAHQWMRDNKHTGTLAVRIQATGLPPTRS